VLIFLFSPPPFFSLPPLRSNLLPRLLSMRPEEDEEEDEMRISLPFSFFPPLFWSQIFFLGRLLLPLGWEDRQGYARSFSLSPFSSSFHIPHELRRFPLFPFLFHPACGICLIKRRVGRWGMREARFFLFLFLHPSLPDSGPADSAFPPTRAGHGLIEKGMEE